MRKSRVKLLRMLAEKEQPQGSRRVKKRATGQIEQAGTRRMFQVLKKLYKKGKLI